MGRGRARPILPAEPADLVYVTFAVTRPDIATQVRFRKEEEMVKGAARLRPDSKLVISREWPTGDSRPQGALQISRGLMRVLAAGEKRELEPA